MRKPFRWPLIQQPANRSDSWTRDARLINAFAEKDPDTGEWQVHKRLGFTLQAALVANGYARGAYTWASSATISGFSVNGFSVVGDGTHANLCVANSVVASNFATDCPGLWNFTEMESDGPYLIFTSPGNSYSSPVQGQLYYTAGVTVSAATLPAGRGENLCGVCYLDETIYTMDEKCNIYGSNLNDVTTWNALNVITAQNIPGWGVGLVKQLSYIIALKTASMEVFYDAGNATGSPLLQIDGATNSFGCSTHELIQTIDDVLLYPSSNITGSLQIVRVDNLVPTVISTPAVEKLIASWLTLAGTYYQDLYSFAFKFWGHRFYGITSISNNLTLVYDIDQNLWYQWTDYLGNYFPLFAPNLQGQTTRQMLGVKTGNLFSYGGDAEFPTDNGNVAPVDIYTPTTDFMTRRRKTLHRLYVRSDQQNGSTLYSRRSDNDMQSWSNFRKIDLSKQTPFLDGEGTFVKRAYHFRHSAATPFRIRSVDLQMDLGTI